MRQVQLPIFPNGVTPINSTLAFEKKDGRVTYFNGLMPVFVHDEDDWNTFYMITSQFYVNGNATQAEIYRAFAIPAINVKRAVKKYRAEGTAGFYKQRKTRGATVLTPEVLHEAQGLLDQNNSIADVSKALDVKRNTINKAILDNRLHKPKKKRSTANCLPATKVSAMP